MTNEEIKKLKRKELVKRLCDSNFSFKRKKRYSFQIVDKNVDLVVY